MERDMRFHINKRKNVDPTNEIIEFLKTNPLSTLMEITKYLQSVGYTFSRPKINTILKDLEKKKIIKNTLPLPAHPRYEIIGTSEFEIQNDSYVFKDQICCNNLSTSTSLKDREMIKGHRDSRKNSMVDMILKLGLISYYSCLSSFERGTSPKLKEKENEELQKIWLRNAMSLENNLNDGLPSTYLKLQIENNIDSDTEDEEPFDEITIPEQIEEAKKLKRLFSKMFPEWYKNFQSDQKVIENMKDRLRDVCINHPEYLLK
jgi:hypothetical protein